MTFWGALYSLSKSNNRLVIKVIWGQFQMFHHCQINKSRERKRNSNLFKCFMQESVLRLYEKKIPVIFKRKLVKKKKKTHTFSTSIFSHENEIMQWPWCTWLQQHQKVKNRSDWSLLYWYIVLFFILIIDWLMLKWNITKHNQYPEPNINYLS